MKKFIAAIFLTIPFSTLATSFDCNKASTAVEKAICSDSELSSLDENLSALYKKTLTVHTDLKASQVEWIKQTRQCEQASSIADCIKTAYEERMSYLNSLAASETLSDTESVKSTGSEGQSAQTDSSEVAPLATTEQKAHLPTEKIDQLSAAADSSNKPEKSSSSLMIVFLLIIAGGIYYFRKRKSTSVESSKLEIKDVQEQSDNLETLFNKGVFLYEKGDFDKAFDFLQEAALRNNAGSQFYLGKILIKNAESKESPSYLKGIDWFKKSAAQSYLPAIKELELIQTEITKESSSFSFENTFDNTKEKENEMNVYLKVMYKNSDSYEAEEDQITLNIDDEYSSKLIDQLSDKPDQDILVEFFKHLYGNPDFDGSNYIGIRYKDLFKIFSNKAWDSLGWSDATVDILEISIEGHFNISLYTEDIDLSQLSLQLARDENGGVMYLYS